MDIVLNEFRVTTTRRGSPTSFGWLRRPDLDQHFGGCVWERPNGSFYIAQPGMALEVVEEWG